MQEIIRYLMNNPEMLEKLKNGTVSLAGLDEVEAQAIIKVFDLSVTPLGYWR
ncbi:competence pheromone ComX [Ureibacillus terrenus]|uniref:competence pheromone ComX n=1 Tax=Ureibacillus terrenus TaxID=118246 RepID=UPI002E224FE6|nr:competence pheromone ComX [Ureibacillus terrenus]